MNRRDFIKSGLAAAAFVPRVEAACCAAKGEYMAFSRVFEFLKDPMRAAAMLKECGYDGVEWTARMFATEDLHYYRSVFG